MPPNQKNPKSDSLQRYGEDVGARSAARWRSASQQVRDIGPLPAVLDPSRRGSCANDFRNFCATYYPEVFSLTFSPDHLLVVGKIEQAVLHGGLFALAMPRGSGKTSICECACVWSVLYGHRDFICLIGATESHASEMLESIQTDVETNDLLLEDFPESCYPVRAMDGIHHRAGGQTLGGEHTNIQWTKDACVFPTVKDAKSSAAIIRVTGITGRIRGMKFKRPDGRSVRPSLVILDDPQTDESARSPSQSAERERVIAGAVLGLAGPGKKIAGVMPCTVIRPGDMADRILKQDLHPEWSGVRCRMVYEWPTNQALWDEYAKIRAAGLKGEAKDGSKLAEATAFYLAHRAEMDAGSRVGWEARYQPDEASAIQHAVDLRLERGERAFWAEFQNDPLPEDLANADDVKAEDVMMKLSGVPRGTVPAECTQLTAFVDVQGKTLWWSVCGWTDAFSGSVVDYGTFPDQKGREYWTKSDAKQTFQDLAPKSGIEAQIYGALERLVTGLMSRDFPQVGEDGGKLRIGWLQIDASWGKSTDIVYQFARESPHSSIVKASHGRYIGAASRPMREWQKKQGERAGDHWRIPPGKRGQRHVIYDVNWWKSFLFSRLNVPIGDSGCLTLYGREPREHRMIADHLLSENRIQVQAQGRLIDEWKLKPDKPDNDWFDCLVGCAVGASILGSRLETEAAQMHATAEHSSQIIKIGAPVAATKKHGRRRKYGYSHDV